MIERQGQHNVSPDFPGVKCAVEPPELHRPMPMEETVKIEKMIAAVVVVLVAVFPITLIPDVLNIGKGFGLRPVQPLNQPGVHFLTIAHPLRFNL